MSVAFFDQIALAKHQRAKRFSWIATTQFRNELTMNCFFPGSVNPKGWKLDSLSMLVLISPRMVGHPLPFLKGVPLQQSKQLWIVSGSKARTWWMATTSGSSTRGSHAYRTCLWYCGLCTVAALSPTCKPDARTMMVKFVNHPYHPVSNLATAIHLTAEIDFKHHLHSNLLAIIGPISLVVLYLYPISGIEPNRCPHGFTPWKWGTVRWASHASPLDECSEG